MELALCRKSNTPREGGVWVEFALESRTLLSRGESRVELASRGKSLVGGGGGSSLRINSRKMYFKNRKFLFYERDIFQNFC